MTALLPAVALILALVDAPAAPPEPLVGWASRYDPAVLEGVVARRFQMGWWRTPPPVDWYTVAGYAATADCAQVGHVVEMRPVGATRWERILVADCAGRDSWQWMVDNRIVAELDFATFGRWAAEWGVPLEVEVRR